MEEKALRCEGYRSYSWTALKIVWSYLRNSEQSSKYFQIQFFHSDHLTILKAKSVNLWHFFNVWTAYSKILTILRVMFRVWIMAVLYSRKLRHGSLVIYSKKQGGGLSSEDLTITS